ncbi:hypothetical protein SAMN05661008_00553 [Alkalithermobacter thermoalcaliphilus JW-YL-7 = DSM 7308]|uniref:Uncharacterized protein n=1 Tax=Alkalithermobacter thermoalcaliphilus JW-YL-7 = DSM 7308 TaxID=1121328 RepID=A0A150FQ80_CLOPD|nr:hypothetical protein JWYL7_0844 [[Clostridium] paradoxum JW-YL-7 = DSM 7308]SHK61337.1 hypothetical protein SAMN05661008_00553 [[Clostridium] paradoxum JW-YL-7 = DSM 7308]
MKKTEANEEKNKPSKIFKPIIIGLLVPIFAIIILYFSSETISDKVNAILKDFPVIGKQFESIPTKQERLERKRTLARYYLSLEEDRVIDKLILLKKEDRKLFDSIVGYMRQLNLNYTNTLMDKIRQREARKDLLQREIDQMYEEKSNFYNQISKYYSKLGLVGTINKLEEDILNLNIDFEQAAKIIEEFNVDFASKVLYYMDENISSSISDNISRNIYDSIKKQQSLHEEYLRKNETISRTLINKKAQEAAKQLEDKSKYSTQDIAYILTFMDYLSAAKILNEFEEKDFVKEILLEINNLEELKRKRENISGFSETVHKALKVLDEYKTDLEKLVKAYEKLSPKEIADLTIKMTDRGQNSYKEYKVSENKSFIITQEDMIIEVLKRLKPRLLSAVISQLETEKAAYISIKIGLPKAD